jgi:hypothetical protein
MPVAVDLRVRIRHGRPWYVYPMPDDYDVKVGQPSFSVTAQRSVIASVDGRVGPTLAGQLREGYPWLTPHHRPYGMASVAPLEEVGFIWQSLTVSPQKLEWMHEPKVGDDPAHAWWKRLREVECSWVSNRGESERFLYYDGPTNLKPPIRVTWNERGLLASAVPPPAGASHLFSGGPRYWIFCVDVRDGGSTWQCFDLKRTNGQLPWPAEPIPAVAQGRDTSTADAFRQLLIEHKLTPSEAAGMVDAWRDAFFQRRGRRALLIFDDPDYKQVCPMTISPTPDEITRVGVLWYELQP